VPQSHADIKMDKRLVNLIRKIEKLHYLVETLNEEYRNNKKKTYIIHDFSEKVQILRRSVLQRARLKIKKR